MFLRLFYISLAFKSVKQADCQLQAFLPDLADRSDESDKLFLFSVNVPRPATGDLGQQPSHKITTGYHLRGMRV